MYRSFLLHIPYHWLFCFSITLAAIPALAQELTGPQTTVVNGFSKKIKGDDFVYHSSIPPATQSLLIRATDGSYAMEWETAVIPQKINTETVTFVWLAGIGSSPGKASFDLFVEGVPKFTIWADGSDTWDLSTPDGYRLSFRKDMIDQHGDRFGFMYLSMPKGMLTPGAPLRLKMQGGRFNKTTWYMTFAFPLEDGLKIKALPALSQDGEKQSQLAVAGILHFGPPTQARVFWNNRKVLEAPVRFGYNYLKMQLPAVEEKTMASYRLEIGSRRWEGQLEVEPVRKWRVNFVQHSHTDIGYTRSQTEILAEHLRFIDYALDYCDLTDHYPDPAKFRWTCEASWAVDEYLRSRPKAQIERLRKRVAEGRIEITGMYFNFDELPDEQILAASLGPLRRIREAGMEVKTAMQNDVNGIGWSLNDYYQPLGVKYLNMGTHGHRALICFDKPTLFWWESPSGNRMLAFRAEHYMTGNTVFKIHTGDFDAFEEKFLSYLVELDAKGYPYDLISIQHSGYLVDNSPPSTVASDIIRQWNEKYSWPRLRTSTATAFFEEMEERQAGDFPVIRGAWPDWWTDGFGASAREVAITRQAQSDLIANASGLCMAAMQGAVLPHKIEDRIEAANSALLFYTEHTLGYHNSVREPFHKYTLEQRRLKESYAWEAGRRAKMLGEETLGLLQSFIQREKEPSLVVYNTLNWSRSGLVKVYVDHQILPRYTEFVWLDQQGNEAPAQAVEHHSDGTYWMVWVNEVPAFGYKKYLLQLKPGKQQHTPSGTPVLHMENQWYQIQVDTLRGAVSSIFDKDYYMELLDREATHMAGEFIYELPDNRSQMEAFRLDQFTREGLEKVWYDGFEEGPVWNSIRFRGNTRAASSDGSYVLEIRMFHHTKRIDFAYEIEKKLVTDPEGIYIAFPFYMDEGTLAFDVQGGEVRAGIDQIPGSANDWNTVQNYARLYNSHHQILLSSPENPLMQFGGINTGRFKAGATPASTAIYGWPMNNYWVTNFNADQHGGHQWVYTLSSGETNRKSSVEFGWGRRTPFLGRILPGGGNGDEIKARSLVSGWPEGLLLVSAMPAEEGRAAIFHVREVAGENIPEVVLYRSADEKPLIWESVDVTGNALPAATKGLKPFESRFIKIWW